MVSVSFQFRTWNANGLLLFSTLADGMLELVLKDGKVMVHISVLQLKSSQADMASGTMDLHFILEAHSLLFYTVLFSVCFFLLANITLCGLANTHLHRTVSKLKVPAIISQC